MDMQRLKRFTELEHRRREIKEELDKVNAELGSLEEGLLRDFEDAGMSSVNIDDLCVYLHRQVWAKPKNGDYPGACAALEQAGLGEMVERRFNTQTLSSWVREQEKAGEKMPESLKDAIVVSEVFSVRTRKGA